MYQCIYENQRPIRTCGDNEMDMIRLGDVCELLNGFAFKSENYVDFGIRVIRIANVQKGFIEDSTPAFYPIDSEGVDKFMLEENDLLMSLTGNVGRVAILAKEFLPAALNQRVACLRMKSDKILKRYLFHILNSDFFEQQCIKSSKGVAQKNMSIEWLKEYEIPLYPLEKQKEIVTVLDNALNIIKERKQQLSNLDTLIKAQFVEIFGDMLINEKEWTEKQLDSVADIVSGITKGRKVKTKELSEVPYMAVSNVKDGFIDWTTVKTIMATRSEIDQYRLMPGDVLMTEGGDPDKLGRGAIIQEPPKNCIHQNHIFRVRLDQDSILPVFMSQYLQQQKAKRYFYRCAKQTTGIASINMKQLKALPVLIPPIEIQREYATFVAQIDKSKATVKKALNEAQLLFDGLMQQYFG